jgi:hypothetical protein
LLTERGGPWVLRRAPVRRPLFVTPAERVWGNAEKGRIYWVFEKLLR